MFDRLSKYKNANRILFWSTVSLWLLNSLDALLFSSTPREKKLSLGFSGDGILVSFRF